MKIPYFYLQRINRQHYPLIAEYLRKIFLPLLRLYAVKYVYPTASSISPAGLNRFGTNYVCYTSPSHLLIGRIVVIKEYCVYYKLFLLSSHNIIK